jgi:hypothetical protein
MQEKIDKAIATAKAIIPSLKTFSDMQKAAQSVLNLSQTKVAYQCLVKPTAELEEEITFVLGRIRSNVGATELQQITQAALHLMQAKIHGEEFVLKKEKTTRKQGGSA